MGMQLNSGKTELLEGDDVAARVSEIEHSAVDGALLSADPDASPLEELVDRLLEHPDTAGRTSLKFVSTRMRKNSIKYRVADLRDRAPRMPHAADILVPLFKSNFANEELQDWFLDYATSEWSMFEWSVAQYGRMFPSSEKPQAKIKEFFAKAVEDANSSIPMRSLACQRLAAWDPSEARAVIRSGISRVANPHARRAMALAALNAGEQRVIIKRWLDQAPENNITLQMLDHHNFRAIKVVADYAD